MTAMTEDKLALHTTLGESAEAAVLRQMIGFALQRLMELQLAGKTGAAYGDQESGLVRAAQPVPRPGAGNPRQLMELRIPKLRKGSGPLLEPRWLAE